MNHRQQTVSDGEPLMVETRKLSISGSGDKPSVMVNIAKEACSITGFPSGYDAVGVEVKVEIYPDRYVVRPIREE